MKEVVDTRDEICTAAGDTVTTLGKDLLNLAQGVPVLFIRGSEFSPPSSFISLFMLPYLFDVRAGFSPRIRFE